MIPLYNVWMKVQKHTAAFFLSLASVFFIVTCGVLEPGVSIVSEEWESDDLPSGEKYLAVTNLSSSNAQVGFSIDYRSLVGASAGAKTRVGTSSGTNGIIKDLPQASRFNANPPPISPEASGGGSLKMLKGPNFSIVGDTKSFQVQNASDVFVSRSAKLISQKPHCNIWVVNDSNGNYDDSSGSNYSDNKVTTTQCNTLGEKFEAIYPLATNLLGYEYGGEPGASVPGGRDGDTKIQILIYDIDGDYTPTQTGGTVGFFWAKDYYTDAELARYGYKSNYAEIFYLDAHFLDKYPDTVYSTLVHEYQHMINFNEKTIKKNLASETWYNEMLSMLAEDVIGPLVGIPTSSSGHVIKERIPLFLDSYWMCGVDQWLSGSNVIISYSNVYAFGAYLIRNCGGPALIKEMLSNNKANHDSITLALKQGINTTNIDSFEKALERYGEALVYSTTKGLGGGKLSFDKTVSSPINGTTYTATGFNIWTIQNTSYFASSGMTTHYGTYAWPLMPDDTIYGHSVCLYIIPSAQTGKMHITLTRPSNVQIKMSVLGW